MEKIKNLADRGLANTDEFIEDAAKLEKADIGTGQLRDALVNPNLFVKEAPGIYHEAKLASDARKLMENNPAIKQNLHDHLHHLGYKAGDPGHAKGLLFEIRGATFKAEIGEQVKNIFAPNKGLDGSGIDFVTNAEAVQAKSSVKAIGGKGVKDRLVAGIKAAKSIGLENKYFIAIPAREFENLVNPKVSEHFNALENLKDLGLWTSETVNKVVKVSGF